MHVFTDREIREAKSLSKYKINAFHAGQKGVLFSMYREDSKLWTTELTSGKYMEVVVAWMLGYFYFSTGVNVYVNMRWQKDVFDGIDFVLRYVGEECTVNLKFDRLAESDTADTDTRYDRCVRVYPSVPIVSKKTQTGEEVAKSILCCVLQASVVSKLFSEHPDMTAAFNGIWEKQSRGWSQ